MGRRFGWQVMLRAFSVAPSQVAEVEKVPPPNFVLIIYQS